MPKFEYKIRQTLKLFQAGHFQQLKSILDPFKARTHWGLLRSYVITQFNTVYDYYWFNSMLYEPRNCQQLVDGNVYAFLKLTATCPAEGFNEVLFDSEHPLTLYQAKQALQKELALFKKHNQLPVITSFVLEQTGSTEILPLSEILLPENTLVV